MRKYLRVLTAVEMSETARKRSYLRQGCHKGTTKAINRAFSRTRLLVTPTPIIMSALRRNAHPRAEMARNAKLSLKALEMLELEIQRRENSKDR